MQGVLAVSDLPLVSMDFKKSDVSTTIDSSLTMVMGDDMVKVSHFSVPDPVFLCLLAANFLCDSPKCAGLLEACMVAAFVLSSASPMLTRLMRLILAASLCQTCVEVSCCVAGCCMVRQRVGLQSACA